MYEPLIANSGVSDITLDATNKGPMGELLSSHLGKDHWFVISCRALKNVIRGMFFRAILTSLASYGIQLRLVAASSIPSVLGNVNGRWEGVNEGVLWLCEENAHLQQWKASFLSMVVIIKPPTISKRALIAL